MAGALSFAIFIGVSVAVGQAGPWRQTQADDYTRYELQDPATQSFRIYYYVTATTPGAEYYFNTIRRGAEETVHGVYDPVTGGPLEWEIVDGQAARALGMANADTADRYIKVRLARPVPEHGERRVLIDKTYRDPASVTVRDGRLYRATRGTLTAWVERLRAETGTSFPEKVTAVRDGMAVHGRYGQPCPACGAPVQRIRYAENEANYCARCQTQGKVLADRAFSKLLKDDWPRSLEEWQDRFTPQTRS